MLIHLFLVKTIKDNKLAEESKSV